MDEQDRTTQIGQMLRSLLLRTARGMQRVGKKQEPGGQIRVFGTEHAGLASAVGVAAEEHAGPRLVQAGCRGSLAFLNIGQKRGTHHRPQRADGVLQPGTVAGSIGGTGRSEGTCLAEWKVAAQDAESGAGEAVGQCPEQRRLSVSSGSVSEDETLSIWAFGSVKKSPDSRRRRTFHKFTDGRTWQGFILSDRGCLGVATGPKPKVSKVD